MTRSGRSTGKYRRHRGSGPEGRLAVTAGPLRTKWRLGPSKPFVGHRMPIDVAVKLWRTTGRPYAAMPHPTKSGPGRM